MCGIAGILMPPGEALPTGWLRESARLLAHRGPDDQGFLLWNGEGGFRLGRDLAMDGPARAGFVHRRLSILDLSEGGWQPRCGAGNSLALIFNGEIYNFVELRAELEGLGHRFASKSDTEVLLAAYAEWGLGALTRLVGMFALALLDLRRRRLVLARDPFGIKPLYLAETAAGIAFASEVAPLLLLPGMRRRADPNSLYRYLRFGLCDHGEATFFAGIRQLPAAHVLEIDLDRPRLAEPRRYWKLPERGSLDIGRREAAARLKDLFVESVRLHLRSDVPVGAALSGGIDSSAIVAAMREIGGAEVDLHSFTYAAGDPAIDEERHADLAGTAARARMHKIRLEPEDLVRDLDSLIAAQQQPFGSTSIYAQYRVFRKAADEGIKVMLDGQGADEMLAGYPSYFPAHAVSLLREGRLGQAAGALARGKSVLGGSWPHHLVRFGAGLVPAPLLRPVFGLWSELKGGVDWLESGWFRERGVSAQAGVQLATSPTLDGALRTTFEETSLPALLRYEDMNSMAHSIESRVPFLTPALVEFLFAVPTRYMIDERGTTKSLFRQAMRGLVPDGILDRRDKIGFQTPEKSWFGTVRPKFEEILSGEPLAALPFLKAAAVREEFAAALAGAKPFNWRVWRWVNTIRWFRLFEVENG